MIYQANSNHKKGGMAILTDKRVSLYNKKVNP